MFSNHSIALSNSLVNVSLSNGNLLLIHGLKLSKLGTLEVGLDSHPDLPPQPGLTNVVVSDGSLAAVQGKLLILQLLELHSGGLTSGTRLQPGKNRTNSVLTDLFHYTKNTSSEENLGVTKTELLFVKLNNIQYTITLVLMHDKSPM